MADVSRIIERIRANGANVAMDSGRLRVVNGDKLPPGGLDFIKAHGKEIAAFLDREAEFNERAAFLEYDGGLTRATAEYITRMLMANPPDGIDPADWTYLVSKGAEVAERGLAA